MLLQQHWDLCRQLAARENLQSAFPARQHPVLSARSNPSLSLLSRGSNFPCNFPFRTISPSIWAPLFSDLSGWAAISTCSMPSYYPSLHLRKKNSKMKKSWWMETTLSGLSLKNKKFFGVQDCSHLPVGCSTQRRQSVTRPNMCGCCSTRGGEGARQRESDNVWFLSWW